MSGKIATTEQKTVQKTAAVLGAMMSRLQAASACLERPHAGGADRPPPRGSGDDRCRGHSVRDTKQDEARRCRGR